MLTSSPRLQAVSLVVAVVGVVGVGIWYAFFRDDAAPAPGRPAAESKLPDPDPPTPDPRLTFSTPFRNVKPDVKYVGDATCAACHPNIDKTFHAHAMGRSAEFVSRAPAIEKYDAAAHNPTTVGNYELRVEKTATGVVHRVRAKDTGGVPLPDYVIPSDLAIGSGTRGRSYLAVRDGVVWQTPISWYGPESRWDLSPGFDLGHGGRRAIVPECLFCHVSLVEPVAGTLNRFREPLLPLQAAVGCERCHGPGSLHVEERAGGAAADAIDTSIVNPKHLAPELRSAICEQCHLQGEERVARRGRNVFEFRPGLPYDLFVTVFVRHPDVADLHHSVGQFEQMEQSRCFLWSNGKLGCTSCHDAHEAPTPTNRDRFYRGRCLTCHESKGCTAPAPERRAKDDSCIACHMPRAASSNIVHTSVTDHRIIRRPIPDTDAGKGLSPGSIPLVPFRPPGRPFTPSEAEGDRDLGIALGHMLGKVPASASGPRNLLGTYANGRLTNSLQRWPGDVAAWTALASARSGRGDVDGWLEAATTAVHLAPNQETALAELASAALAASRYDVAMRCADKLIQLSPTAIDPLLTRATIYTRQQEWARAEADCRAALAIHPLHPSVRLLLGICRHRQGDPVGGRREAEIAGRLTSTPAQRAEFQARYERETR